LDVITAAFFGLLDNVEIVRMGAPPIAASEVQVAVQALRGSSSVTATIRTNSDVAAELARRSFEAQLPDKSQARTRLGLVVRETPSCTVSITRLHVAEIAPVTPQGVALSAHRVVGRESSDDDRISFIEYLDQHEGFVVALGIVVFVPLLLIVVCCLMRRCRKREGKEVKGVKEGKGTSGSGSGAPVFRKTAPNSFSEDSEELERATATMPPEFEVFDSLSRERLSGPGPIIVNPAFLPVDAYHGIPPKSFQL